MDIDSVATALKLPEPVGMALAAGRGNPPNMLATKRYFMKLARVFVAAASVAILAMPRAASAQNYVLHFPQTTDGVLGNTCADASCSNGEAISAAYGSVAGVVTATHGFLDFTLLGMTGGTGIADYWGTLCCGGLSGGAGYAQGDANDYGFWQFTPIGGNTSITLNSIKLAYFQTRPKDVTVKIWDNSGVLYSSTTSIGDGGGTVSPGITSNGPLRVFWGGFNAAGTNTSSLQDWLADDINITVGTSGTTLDVVPEPATMMLMATGLVGMSGMTRIRRRKKS